MGIKNGRLDISYNRQDSSLEDPVTGEDRQLSGEALWDVDISLRQDLASRRLSYGIGYVESDLTTRCGLDEITTGIYVPGMTFFIEKSFANGYKLRFDAMNVLNQGAHRERRVYACLVHQGQFSLLRKGSVTTTLTLDFLLAAPSSIEAENQFSRHNSLEV